MIEIILMTFMTACTAVFMVNFNNPYMAIIEDLKLYRKPFNCTKCTAWWLGVIVAIACSTHIMCLMIAPTSALFAIVIEKAVKSLPHIF